MPTQPPAGIEWPGTVHHNLSAPELAEVAIIRDEAMLSDSGAVVTRTGDRSGRCPKDRFFVAIADAAERIAWSSNQAVSREMFEGLSEPVRNHLEGADLFAADGYLGADPHHRIKLRVTAELAWHALFALQLFRRLPLEEHEGFEPDFEILSAPLFDAEPERDGTKTNAFIGLDVERRRVLICGTHYAGEMKKSLFTSANYLLPEQGVLPMHCSANIGPQDDVALFFGLSGTGKTTLSADPNRRLIGDDEHGWSEQGVFNLEGGCYAKCIDLSPEKEPQIWNAIRFGAVVENAVMDARTRRIAFEDDSITENTRAAYPLEFIDNYVPGGRGGHASWIVFLTADAFGVLPPISKLDADSAMYHFLSGFTAKLAGTEGGLGSEPQATFSTCFGAPFLPLPPKVYAGMLGERITRHGARVWLVNTGWVGGPYGVGERMDLTHTRALVDAATSGVLDRVETRHHPILNLDMPVSCPGVPEQLLDPRSTWDDYDAYEAKARELAQMFADNFDRFKDDVPPEVVKAGPAEA